ncbi:uncharacterized protein LOC113305315 [Papaver somniferum]|uniref:uncharacterized protein LOC113305315 n=1 Tax=Papaver somniferum TaxID=3469 RepID=UPI000E6FFC42|nr:uncharacterized protein LOC113305315 [Papaver somniferum]
MRWRWCQIQFVSLTDLKLISWNLRGMNAFDKILALKNLVLEQKCDVCMVQETKMIKMNQWMVRQIWYDAYFDWEYIPSTGTCGRSGGLLTIWNNNKLIKEGGRMGKNSISTLFSQKDDGFKWEICNMYSPCGYNERAVFWSDMEEVRNWWNGPICFAGGVNAVRCDEERNMGECDSRNTALLNNFITTQELVDLPLLGGAYTWSDMQVNPLLCRLDIFFLSVEMDLWFPAAIQVALTSVTSDHKPIMLVTKPNIDCKPYFKFENSWIMHKDILRKVEQWWGIMKFQRIPSFVFFKKLQNLKYFLKNWRREEFGGVKKEKDGLTEKIDCLDHMDESYRLSHEQFEEMLNCMLRLKNITVRELGSGIPGQRKMNLGGVIQTHLTFSGLLMQGKRGTQFLNLRLKERNVLTNKE